MRFRLLQATAFLLFWSGPTMNLLEAQNISDLREMTRRRLPRVVFETIESGVEDERGVVRNEQAFDKHCLLPRYLVDVEKIDLTTTLFGRNYAAPFGFSPTGFAGVFRRGADTMMAKTACAANVPMIISGSSIETLEDVNAVAPKHVWSHVYTAKDPDVTEDLLARAEHCGIDVLVITVDNPVYPNRERDARNRFGKSIASQKLSTILDAMSHPAWCIEFLAGGGFPKIGNWARYAGPNASGPDVAAYYRSQSPVIVTWKDLEKIRSRWPGRLIVKGVQHPEDALLCLSCGVDGIVVSNHGGKAHDRLPASLDALPFVRRAVGDAFPVMIDGGIRRGADIVIAACLGASFAFIGRPALYGVVAGGECGVAKAVSILKREIDLTLALIGCPSFAELNQDFLFSGN